MCIKIRFSNKSESAIFDVTGGKKSVADRVFLVRYELSRIHISRENHPASSRRRMPPSSLHHRPYAVLHKRNALL
jgi:hypothetical protein